MDRQAEGIPWSSRPQIDLQRGTPLGHVNRFRGRLDFPFRRIHGPKSNSSSLFGQARLRTRSTGLCEIESCSWQIPEGICTISMFARHGTTTSGTARFVNPCENAFCVDLDRIRAERDDASEQLLAGKQFAELTPKQHPPCKAESGAFMNSREWIREFNHPYQSSKKTQATHGQLKPTKIKVEPYSTFAVPFLWMLREQQEEIDNSLPQPLPPDDEPPFASAWVFSKTRQEALCELFFDRLTPGKSLAFFYTNRAILWARQSQGWSLAWARLTRSRAYSVTNRRPLRRTPCGSEVPAFRPARRPPGISCPLPRLS